MSGDVHRAEGWKVPAATMVKNAVSVPVVATGRSVTRISWIRSSMTASATWSAWAAAFWLSANG